KEVESRLSHAIHLRFGLAAVTPVSLKRLIKKADNICAWFEATQLAGFDETESDRFFGHPPKGLHIDLEPEATEIAQSNYTKRVENLLSKIKVPV
ncbi:MAG: HD family hydrolase, partial [Pseudomonadota bacterium]